MIKSLWYRLRYGSGGRPQDLAEMGKRLEYLQSELGKVTVNLDTISKELVGQPSEVIIERVYVDKVNLDRIIFDIDGMDVKDLSGSLSIGLNYGGKVIRVRKKPITEEPFKKNGQPPKGSKPEEPGRRSKPAYQENEPKQPPFPPGGQPSISIGFNY